MGYVGKITTFKTIGIGGIGWEDIVTGKHIVVSET